MGFVLHFLLLFSIFLSLFLLLLLFYSCLMSVEDVQNKNLIVVHNVVIHVTIKFET